MVRYQWWPSYLCLQSGTLEVCAVWNSDCVDHGAISTGQLVLREESLPEPHGQGQRWNRSEFWTR